MTDEELAALCAKATPGPWESVIHGGHYRTRSTMDTALIAARTYGDSLGDLADAAFIAAARTAIPELLKRAQTAEAALAKVRDELGSLLPNPKRPDWMPALSSKNSADAECLQRAWDAIGAALGKGD